MEANLAKSNWIYRFEDRVYYIGMEYYVPTELIDEKNSPLQIRLLIFEWLWSINPWNGIDLISSRNRAPIDVSWNKKHLFYEWKCKCFSWNFPRIKRNLFEKKKLIDTCSWLSIGFESADDYEKSKWIGNEGKKK